MRQNAECALGRIFNQSNQIIHVTFMAGVNKICLFDLPSHAGERKEKAAAAVQDQHVQYAVDRLQYFSHATGALLLCAQ